VRKTWLSGMSPVAADLASACSAEGADGDAEAVLVLVVGAAAGGEGFVVVAGFDVCDEPQPARPTATSTTTNGFIASGCRGAPERRLNGSPP